MRNSTLATTRTLAVALIGFGALALPACGGETGGQATPGSGGASAGTGGGSGGGQAPGSGGSAPGTGGSAPVADAGSGGAPVTDGGPAAADGMSDTAGNPGGGAFNADVMTMMRKVADWQLPTVGGAKDWIHGAMWTGLMTTYNVTKDPKYLAAVVKWAGDWSLAGGAGARGDNQCAAQTFFDAYLVDPTPANMVRLTAKSSFDQLVANTPAGRTEWWWEDALFMVPPGFARLGAATGNKQYFATMNQMYWDTYAFLWNAQASLMYRDHRGNDNSFWSRGNGWVIGGAVRVLDYLPADDPKRPNFVKLVQDMSGALKAAQGMDGCWRSNILNQQALPNPETTGSGFFTFGIAWGVNHGILDKATYQPIAQKGWDCLVSHVDATGKLGYAQPVGAGPGVAPAGNSEPFGVGAFLLAGSEIGKFAQ